MSQEIEVGSLVAIDSSDSRGSYSEKNAIGIVSKKDTDAFEEPRFSVKIIHPIHYAENVSQIRIKSMLLLGQIEKPAVDNVSKDDLYKAILLLAQKIDKISIFNMSMEEFNSH